MTTCTFTFKYLLFVFRYLLWPDWIFFIRCTEWVKTMLIILALGHNLSDRSTQEFLIEFINFLQGTIISTCSPNNTNWNDTWSVILFFSNFNMNFGLGISKIISYWVGFVVQLKVAPNIFNRIKVLPKLGQLI